MENSNPLGFFCLLMKFLEVVLDSEHWLAFYGGLAYYVVVTFANE
jgi:hypothetical protein